MENYFEKVSAMRELSRNSKERKIAAKEMRNERIDELKAINYRVKPTKGIDNGAGGKIAELEETREGSEKYKVSGAGRVDNYVTIDGKARAIEIKTNSGRIGNILRALERGKDGFIVYGYSVQNANTKGELWEVPKKSLLFRRLLHCWKASARFESIKAMQIKITSIANLLFKQALKSFTPRLKIPPHWNTIKTGNTRPMRLQGFSEPLLSFCILFIFL